LQGRDDFSILSVAASLEVTKDDDFDKIKQSHGLLAAQLGQLVIEVAAHRHELFCKPFLLIVTPGFEINAISGA
jgi:predicted DNA-binding protein YlxM (UPF0122 family)